MMIRNANGDVLSHRRTQKDCICKRGKERENCAKCEGTGKVMLFRVPKGAVIVAENKPEDKSGLQGVADWMLRRNMPKFEGAPAEFLTTESMQAEHDFIHGLQAKRYAIGAKFPIGSVGDAIARRRGTGPKATLKKFLDAFDAWDKFIDDCSGDLDGLSYEELGKLATLEADMHKARADVRGLMGVC